jgi:uncharacterized protein
MSLTEVPDLPALYATLLTGARPSRVHGPWHWQRVATIGHRLLARTVDPAVVFTFSLVHDAARQHDGRDRNHGRRAALLVDQLVDRGLLVLAVDQAQLLRAACAGHADGRTSNDATIGACWDADRLDLWRLGCRPDPVLLSTQAARDLVRWAQTMRPLHWDDLWHNYQASVTPRAKRRPRR